MIMLRIFFNSAVRTGTAISKDVSKELAHYGLKQRSYVTFLNNLKPYPAISKQYVRIFEPHSNNIIAPPSTTITQQLVRTLTKFSLVKGKRKSVKAVVKRFKRLNWGIWIRTRSGRHKKLFKKSPALRKRLRQHIFTNATQSWLLDKMVTKFWRKPKYYIDDPYTPYHKRDEFIATKSKTFKV